MIEWIQSNWMSIVGTVYTIRKRICINGFKDHDKRSSLKEDSYTNGRKAC